MGKPVSWRDKAIAVIADLLLEYEAQCLCLEVAQCPKAARDYCNQHYPFGMRRYTPYKVWLKELRLVEVFVESRQSAIAYKPWRSKLCSDGSSRASGTRQRTEKPVEGQLALLESAE